MPTHYRGSTREKRVLDTYIKLMRAAGSVLHRQSPVLAKFGLTSGQFGALEVLHHLGPMRQKDLGQKLFSSEGNITFIVDNLEKRRLIERVRLPEDRRAYLLHLTPAAEKLIRKVFPLYLQNLMQQMAVLSESEQQQLGILAKKLGLQTSGTF